MKENYNNDISYKQIIDTILKCMPLNMDLDQLKINDINNIFDTLNFNFDLNIKTLKLSKKNIINLLNNYMYYVYDENSNLSKKSLYEIFRTQLNDYRVYLFNNIRLYYKYTLYKELHFMNKEEIINYDINDIEKFIKYYFYIDLDKVTDLFFINNDYIKMLYTYFGIENKMMTNLYSHIRMDKHLSNINQSYKNKGIILDSNCYSQFINILTNDISKKFILKQKATINNNTNNNIKKM